MTHRIEPLPRSLREPDPAASDELFNWKPAPVSRVRAISRSACVVVIVAGLSQLAPGDMHIRAAVEIDTPTNTAATAAPPPEEVTKHVEAAEQRASVHRATLKLNPHTPPKWNPPLATSSVVRDITPPAKD